MEIKNGSEMLNGFVEKCEQDKDAYLVCHFSSIEDKFNGFHGNMDTFDAGIIIKFLVKEFGISDLLLKSFSNKLKKQTTT